MGMYTELNIGVKICPTPTVLQKLNYMLGEDKEDVHIEHPLFIDQTRWKFMLLSDSYYFDGQTDSKLFVDDLYPDEPMYFLNVRCNLKNYDEEIEKFMDWLCPYIETEGFLGYERYEEFDDPTLIYKENGEIVYKSNKGGRDMHNIEITMEKIARVSKSFEVPDSVYEEIKRTNRIPDDYFHKMEEICEDTDEDTEYDYAVYDEDYEKQLIEWG